MSNPFPKVLVYGANSAQGIPVVHRLMKEGYQVRAFVRDRHKAKSLFPENVEIVSGSLEDKSSLQKANAEIDRVFLVLPLEYRFDVAVNQGINAIAAARDAGVKLIVFNTSTNIPSEITDVPAFEIKRTIANHIHQSGIPYIILRPPLYMDNFAAPWSIPSIVHQSVVAYPLPNEVKISWISLNDAAAFAVSALSQPELAGSTFDIGGIEALSGDDIAERFTRALSRPFTYQQIPIDAFEDGLNQAFGEPAGTEIAKIYRWRAANPEEGKVEMNPLLQTLPVELTTFYQWIKDTNWSIS